MKKKTLLLPIEVKVRELNAKVLLALAAAQKGMRIYLGSKSGISLIQPKLTSGIYFFKSGNFAKDILKVKENASHFVVLDEEMGPAVIFFDLFLDFRGMFEDSLPLIDLFFAFGKSDGEAMQRVYKKGEAIHFTGWPRIDLWRPEFAQRYHRDVEKIRSTYGSYIFIPSNFSINSQAFKEHAIKEVLAFKKSKEVTDFLMNNLEMAQKAASDYTDLITQISVARPHLNFILRPHPSDDHEEWHKMLDHLPNVKVIFEGDISPWIYASSAVIHYGCTTAVQAGINGIPLLTYKPPTTKHGDSIPFIISEKANTPAEVLDFLDQLKWQTKEKVQQRVKGFIKDNIVALDGELAAARIAQVLSSLDTPELGPVSFSLSEKIFLSLRKKASFLKSKMKLSKSLIDGRRPVKIKGGISRDEVYSLIEKFSQQLNIPMDSIHCRQLPRDVVEIEIVQP